MDRRIETSLTVHTPFLLSALLTRGIRKRQEGLAQAASADGPSQLTPAYYYSQRGLLESLAHPSAFGYVPNLRLRKSRKKL